MTETSQPEAPPEQQQQVNPFIGDEGAFLRSLGVEPVMVVDGTVKIEWTSGTPFILFTARQAVTPQALGMAFLASAPAEPEQPQQPPMPAMPEDHRPPLAAVPPPAPDSDAADDAADPAPVEQPAPRPARKATTAKRAAKKAPAKGGK